jgi:hypothetical protein
MIVEWLFNIISGIVLGFINFFPALVVPTDLLNSLGGLVELLAVASYFMPVGVLQLCLIVWFSFNSIRGVVVIINWVIGKIPTIN